MKAKDRPTTRCTWRRTRLLGNNPTLYLVERLATDLQKAFPGIEGFSSRNIWRMRAFYLAWTEEIAKLPRPVAEVDGQNLPQPVAEIPWGHNVWLLEKVKDPVERLWYAQRTLMHGWSRPVLVSSQV